MAESSFFSMEKSVILFIRRDKITFCRCFKEHNTRKYIFKKFPDFQPRREALEMANLKAKVFHPEQKIATKHNQ
jgi:hypothetical protein